MIPNGVEPPSSVDKRRLRQLYRSNNAARAIFDHLAKRERNWKAIDVDTLALKIAEQASRPEVMGALKALEEAGCGKYIAGRKGHKSRFQWSVDMVAVGRYASGQPTDIEEIDPRTAGEDEVAEGSDVQSEVSENGAGLSHRFQLRRDLVVSLALPANLAGAEAGRLADFIRTLPFDD